MENNIEDFKSSFNKIQEENIDNDITNYLAKTSDLPNLKPVVLCDYELYVKEALDLSTELLQAYVDRYIPEIKDQPGIKIDIKDDASKYASTLFDIKITEKATMNIMNEIDAGHSSANMYNSLSQMIREHRDSIKCSNDLKNKLKVDYLEIRGDIGMNKIQPRIEEKQNKENKNNQITITGKELNKMIEKQIKK